MRNFVVFNAVESAGSVDGLFALILLFDMHILVLFLLLHMLAPIKAFVDCLISIHQLFTCKVINSNVHFSLVARLISYSNKVIGRHR